MLEKGIRAINVVFSEGSLTLQTVVFVFGHTLLRTVTVGLLSGAPVCINQF